METTENKQLWAGRQRASIRMPLKQATTTEGDEAADLFSDAKGGRSLKRLTIESSLIYQIPRPLFYLEVDFAGILAHYA